MIHPLNGQVQWKVYVVALAMITGLGSRLHGQASTEVITDHFRMLTPTFKINQGKAVNQLSSVKGTEWADMTPFVTPDTVELWTADGVPANVHAIAFHTLYDKIKAGKLQAWIDGNWQHVAPLPNTVTDDMLTQYLPEATSMRARHELELPEPVQTTGLRLVITEQANTDHDVLTLLAMRIEGRIHDVEQPATPGMRFAVAAEFNVFDLPAPAEVDIELRSESPQKVHLETHWHDSIQRSVQPPQRHEIKLKRGEPESIRATLADVTQGPYFLTARVSNPKGVLLECKNVMIGMRDPALLRTGQAKAYRPRDVEVPTIEKRLKRRGALWSAAMIHSVANMGMPPAKPFFRANAEAGGELIAAYQMYHVYEPLPGVYNFAWFDHLIDLAEAHGLGLEMGLWRIDQDPTPRQWWLADQRAVIPYGRARRRNQYSLFAPRYRHHSERAVQVMVSRYRQCPEIWIWTPHPFGFADHDAYELYDTSVHGKRAYREFLREKYGAIKKVNEAYDTNFQSFDSLPIPRPLWRTYEQQGDHDGMTRALDTRRQWTEYLYFYHHTIADMRERFLRIVRNLDTKRGISGINANGGVGAADRNWQLRKEYRAFDGDQGINIPHYVRRLVALQRYDLPRRHEDISPVSPGRKGIRAQGAIDRAHWDLFEHCTLGTKQFNYVFPTTDGSPFWDYVYSQPRVRQLVKRAARAQAVTVPAAYLHSFRTERLQGVYRFSNISIQRWWIQNAISVAWIRSGSIPQVYSAEGVLEGLNDAHVILDSGSRMLPPDTVDQLVKYVRDGGKLVLFATAGEHTAGQPDQRFELLRRLGYPEPQSLTPRKHAPTQLVFDALPGLAKIGQRGINTATPPAPKFGQCSASMPIHFYTPLSVPEGGKPIGWIGRQVGAVQWSQGEGEIILLAGEPGGVPEARLYDTPAAGETGVKSPLRQNAQTELNHVMSRFWDDVLDWADVQPPIEIDGSNQLLHSVRREGGDWLIYLYNPEWQAVHPRLRIMPFRDADIADRYRAHWWQLRRDQKLSDVDGKTLLGGGITLPELGARRFARLRLSADGATERSR